MGSSQEHALNASGERSGWLVVNIGCIECGVSSNVVGLFATEAEATSLARRLDRTHGWREHGQNEFEVYRCPQVGEPIPAEYANPDPIEAEAESAVGAEKSL